MSACCGPDRSSVQTGGEFPGTGGRSASPEKGVLEQLAAQASAELRLVGLAGGPFLMGSDDRLAYPEDGEGPVREVQVAEFALGATTVTAAQFAAFVLETGHRTDAELYGSSLVFSGLLTEELRASTPAVVDAPWWRQVSGADWLHPEGPGTSAVDRADHPVTHVSHRDATAYADWVGARLPTEAEWEFAARGGLEQQPFPWGGIREPGGEPRMNTFPGAFPDGPTGPVGTVTADSFAPNAYGLHNMTGNVWEWTDSRFAPGDARLVLRGGSYMCHASYCRRYRTSARTASTAETSLGHTGFRLAVSVGGPSGDERTAPTA